MYIYYIRKVSIWGGFNFLNPLLSTLMHGSWNCRQFKVLPVNQWNGSSRLSQPSVHSMQFAYQMNESCAVRPFWWSFACHGQTNCTPYLLLNHTVIVITDACSSMASIFIRRVGSFLQSVQKFFHSRSKVYWARNKNPS